MQQSASSNYSIKNQKDIILDTAQNLTQIVVWSKSNFKSERERILLFLKLTRKNLDALITFPLPEDSTKKYKKIVSTFAQKEKDFQAGFIDPHVWANGLIKIANSLTQSIENL